MYGSNININGQSQSMNKLYTRHTANKTSDKIQLFLDFFE